MIGYTQHQFRTALQEHRRKAKPSQGSQPVRSRVNMRETSVRGGDIGEENTVKLNSKQFYEKYLNFKTCL